MEPYKRHKIVWRVVYAATVGIISRAYNLSHDDINVEGPCLIVSNHVSSLDPLLVLPSLKHKHAYFVASEHLFRQGWITRLMKWGAAPISRRKASSGIDTVKACLQHLRAGHSICLFAEGETSWNGRSIPVFPATGKLAQRSGATLITYRLEGVYLSNPRWGKGLRRGRVYGHTVKIYSPEQLKAMTPQEIDAAINRDIGEDAWERQKESPAAYRGYRRAEGLEKALYLCPECGKVSTLSTINDLLFCTCGYKTVYTPEGFFDPPVPFENIAQWDDWQQERFRQWQPPADTLLFSDEDLELSKITPDHGEIPIAEKSELKQYSDRLECGGMRFSLSEMSNMAMVRTRMLLFSWQNEYYQIRTRTGVNLRKYLTFFQTRTQPDAEETKQRTYDK